MNKICVIIPTLNEEKNILKIYTKIKNTKINLDILFVDDNSKDKSQKIIKQLSKNNKKIKYLFRKKCGIGSAHKDGIKYCYKKRYETIITMDSDGTHDPIYFKKLLSASKKYDLVSTSRFNKKNLISDWPLSRKIITYARHYLIILFLSMRFDASGAFRCFKTKKIKLKDILKARTNSYTFFWESLYILSIKKYTIHEISVRLIYRKLGNSKMKLYDIIFAFFYLINFFVIKRILKRY
jgi:dolichol-phosphate mannosyltransferase